MLEIIYQTVAWDEESQVLNLALLLTHRATPTIDRAVSIYQTVLKVLRLLAHLEGML